MEVKIRKRSEIIKTGNFTLDIFTIEDFKTSDVAIISNFSGEFSMIKDAGIKMKGIKKKFQEWLNSKEIFTFDSMPREKVKELIAMMKNK